MGAFRICASPKQPVTVRSTFIIDEPQIISSEEARGLHSKNLIKKRYLNICQWILTHNSTVGASIKPDYLVYTAKVRMSMRVRPSSAVSGLDSDRN